MNEYDKQKILNNHRVQTNSLAQMLTTVLAHCDSHSLADSVAVNKALSRILEIGVKSKTDGEGEGEYRRMLVPILATVEGVQSQLDRLVEKVVDDPDNEILFNDDDD